MPIGLYICQCNGRVSNVIVTAALAKELTKAKGVALCREHANVCSADGLALVRADMQSGAIDRVVIAGCSPRAHKEAIEQALADAGLNPYLIERCNILEQCALPHADAPEQATRKAKTLIAMSLAKARLLEPLTPLTFPGVNRALVVGGGIAGLSAASDLVAAGVQVTLIEKQPYLGGRVVGLHKYFPRMCPPQCGVDFIVERTKRDARVAMHTQTQVETIAGSPGNFDVTLRREPRYVDAAQCNACGKCAEVCPATRSDPFEFGRRTTKAIYLPHAFANPRAYVIDRELCPPDCNACVGACPTHAIQLDATASRENVNVGGIVMATGWEPFDARAVERYGYGRFANVVTNLEFERVASRDGFTDGTLARVSDGAPVGDIAFIQCVGSRDVAHLPYCSQICCAVTLKQIAYIKELNPDARVTVFYMDMRAIGDAELLYREAQEKHGAIFVRGNPFEIVEDATTKQLTVRAEDTLSARQIELCADMVVLATGIQPNGAWTQTISPTAQSAGGFAAGHVQCFPYDTQRAGIYAAGATQGPMDVMTAVKSAGGAAMKAMASLRQQIEIRPTVPVLDKTKCDKCKRCMEECPFDAYYWDATGYPAPDYLKCRQCGICQGACPMRVISLKNFSIKQGAQMIAAINPGFAGKEQPTILAFLCANDAYPAADLAGQQGLVYPANVVTIPAPCAGSINVAWVTDALSAGIDGVMIFGCDSKQCHFVQGSDLARTRLANMQETLKRMMVEPERIKMLNLGINDAAAYAQHIRTFVTDLLRLGPSPFK
ncbi:MAG: hydrogenase iron-sulfur subunit [Chloroflexi bacterium]|nr:hydrogenase iron-sulfur subunit [Chloroflexota bacterium]